VNPCAVRAFTVGDHLVRFIPIVFACPPKCRQRRQKPVGRLPSRETTLEVIVGFLDVQSTALRAISTMPIVGIGRHAARRQPESLRRNGQASPRRCWPLSGSDRASRASGVTRARGRRRGESVVGGVCGGLRWARHCFRAAGTVRPTFTPINLSLDGICEAAAASG
jgi:hypothetical protein